MKRGFAFAERIYGAMLGLYPASFRAAFEQQMRLSFRDACRDAYRQGGSDGLLALWFATLLDLIKTVLEERVRRGEIIMSKQRLIAWAGPLTMIVGLLWMAASIGEFVLLVKLGSMDTFWDIFWFFPIVLSFVFMIPASIGTRLRYQEDASGLGRFGFVLSMVGCIGMMLFFLIGFLLGVLAPEIEQDIWPDYVIAVLAMCIMIGYMLFGIDALRNRLLPRWNIMPLLVGLPSLILLVPSLITENAVPRNYDLILTITFLRFALTGICWVMLGYVMQDRWQKQEVVGGRVSSMS